MTFDIPDTEWRRVSPRYLRVEIVTLVISAVVVVGGTTLSPLLSGNQWLWFIPGGLFIYFVLALLFTQRRISAIGYQLRNDDLLFRKGRMFRRFVAVPYGRMQLIDISSGPIMRANRLSELKFVTAAAATKLAIPGLDSAEAESLRDTLVALAESRRAGL